MASIVCCKLFWFSARTGDQYPTLVSQASLRFRLVLGEYTYHIYLKCF